MPAVIGAARQVIVGAIFGTPVDLPPETFLPDPPRAILTRVLLNLRRSFEKRSLFAEALAALDCAGALDPDETSVLRERGLLRAGCYADVVVFVSDSTRAHLDRAIETLEYGMQIGPNNIALGSRLAKLLIRAPELSLRWIPVWRRNLLVWRKLAIASVLVMALASAIVLIGAKVRPIPTPVVTASRSSRTSSSVSRAVVAEANPIRMIAASRAPFGVVRSMAATLALSAASMILTGLMPGVEFGKIGEAFGDYLAGSSHVLPTDGWARACSGGWPRGSACRSSSSSCSVIAS